jgi:esterase/lipase superfamily enzyme
MDAESDERMEEAPESVAIEAPDSEAPDSEAPVESPPYEIIPVFYGTDRQVDPSLIATVPITKPEDIRKYYGPTEETPSSLHLGVCKVSVPTRPNGKPREIGTIPVPGMFESARQSEHFMATELEPLDVDQFRGQINAAIGLLPGKKQAFVYIHGFDNTFENAAFRAAQMYVDLDVKCVPIMYTWPSRGMPTKYKEDRAQVVRSIPRIQEFLSLVARETDAEIIHLIAHSMGTQLLTTALASLPQGEAGDLPRINQIILAAPDIDAQEFVSQIAPKIERFGQRITIYQSNRDEALYLSQFFMNNPVVPRLGLRPIDLSSLKNESKFNQVDATWVANSDYGHTYFGNTSDVIGDVRLVLDGHDVVDRNMLPSYLMRGEVEPWDAPPTPWHIAAWKLLPGAAIGAFLMFVIGLFRRQRLAAKTK